MTLMLLDRKIVNLISSTMLLIHRNSLKLKESNIDVNLAEAHKSHEIRRYSNTVSTVPKVL